MAAGDNHTNQECTDYAAVNRHSPFPGVPDRGEIVLILVPGENYKVQPRADNAADQAAQHDVDQLVGVDAKRLVFRNAISIASRMPTAMITPYR